MALNEGGDGAMLRGRYRSNNVQAAEKVYQSYRLEVTHPGGHSSLPVRDNAIYWLAGALTRLAAFDFPVRLDEVNRAFFGRQAAIIRGPLADDLGALARGEADPAVVSRVAAIRPFFNAMLRTTCVATRLDAGHADNALPQAARATVNCRLLPGDSEADVHRQLVAALAEDRVAVTRINRAFASPPSPLTPEIMEALEVGPAFADAPAVPQPA